MSIERREIILHVNELVEGMRVVRLDRPWLGTDFPIQGFVIAGQKDIEDLKRQCDYVFVETVEHAAGNYGGAARPPFTPPRQQGTSQETSWPVCTLAR